VFEMLDPSIKRLLVNQETLLKISIKAIL